MREAEFRKLFSQSYWDSLDKAQGSQMNVRVDRECGFVMKVPRLGGVREPILRGYELAAERLGGRIAPFTRFDNLSVDLGDARSGPLFVQEYSRDINTPLF